MKVLVVGDTILDHYVYGTVSRVSPEAPHSVVLDVSDNEEVRLGGAGNVAANIRGLRSNDVIHYFGIYNDVFAELLLKHNIAIPSIETLNREILIKTRFVCDKHHLLRVDRGDKYYLTNDERVYIIETVAKNNYDLVVFSDYNKGTIDSLLCEVLLNLSKNVIIDLKKSRNISLNSNKNNHIIIKCNKSEFEAEIDHKIIDRVKAVVKTLGSDGCEVFVNKKQINIPAPQVDTVADVVGAGDTFLAGMAANFLETGDFDPVNMAKFGTKCASEKVKHFGTYAIRKEDLK